MNDAQFVRVDTAWGEDHDQLNLSKTTTWHIASDVWYRKSRL